MASRPPSREGERFATSLHGRVLTQGRSFPVTITALSHEGLVAEGSECAQLLGGFTIEIALESSSDTSWNPKTGGPHFLHLFSAAAEPDADSPDSDGRTDGRLNARFTNMADPARRILSDYIRQLAGGRAARSAGGALSRPLERFVDGG